MQIFRFPSFRLCPFYPTGINIGSKRPQHVLKHAEKQAEIQRVQSSEPVLSSFDLITKCHFGLTCVLTFEQQFHFLNERRIVSCFPCSADSYY